VIVISYSDLMNGMVLQPNAVTQLRIMNAVVCVLCTEHVNLFSCSYHKNGYNKILP
jgi:hypothetical protein